MSTPGHAPNPQFIFRCEQCNKPFDKQTTLKRHGYYCRSRKFGTAARLRSCFACAKGKAACDHAQPECSRCAAKSIRCHYPANSRKPGGGRGPQQNIEPSVESGIAATTPLSSADSPSLGNGQEESGGGDLILHSGLDIPLSDFPGFEDNYLGWGETNINFADFLDNTRSNSMSNPSSSFPSLVPMLTSTADEIAQGQEEQLDPHSSQQSIPPSPSFMVRSLIRRPKLQPASQQISNLILHMLKSYPLMMLRHDDALPPFIHPSLVLKSDGVVEENRDTAPLTNCMSLMHMLGSRVQGSRRLFWKNVRMECERLLHEHGKLNKWELLTAMQALSIYILIRVDEGETEDNNFDFLLIKTIISVIQQFSRVDVSCASQCGLCNEKLQLTWKEWIFRESRRRLAVVYRVVNMLIYFEPAGMCDMPTEFILAPLPAKKQLWEARDEFSWLERSEGEPGLRVSFGLAADGEVVKLDNSQLSCSDTWLSYQSVDDNRVQGKVATRGWEEWCAGMDGLGGLVMLAASLI